MKLSLSWRQAILITCSFLFFYSVYLFLRHGSFSISSFNKATGATAALLAAVTLLRVSIRKQLGLMAFYVGIVHMVISLFFIPSRFNLAYYLSHWLPASFGVVAILIWTYLALISNTTAMKKLGQKWRLYQSIGARFAFLGIALHIGLLKYQEMVTWYQGKGTVTSYLTHPFYPPASLFVFGIVILVLIYRKLFISK